MNMHYPAEQPMKLSYMVSFFLVLLGTTGLYWEGLHSIFILDDEPNLQSLKQITDENTWVGIGKFITEGITSRLGRPLSLLTFALQYHHWPTEVWSFKYVNLMIHLINACLIFWLILLLGRLLDFQRPLLIALLTMTLWLVHPFHVSTVLYVVQRMTELSALFTLVGLLAYLQGRHYFTQGLVLKGFVWVSLGVSVGGILATLSKETGVLLVFYISVLEITLFHSLPSPPYWRIWKTLFIYGPITLLSAYFIIHFNDLLNDYQIREFTMGERLLTEARILCDYLAKILLLRPDAFSLFQDDYPISRSLFSPITTFISLIFLVSLLVMSLILRRSFPLFAFAVLWFFAGHLLESSFIGLIPYFEHRNYLPMLGVLFALVYGTLALFQQMSTPSLRTLAMTFSGLVFSLFPLLTSLQTNLWANPIEQAIFWAEKKPYSRFAQSHVAEIFEKLGHYDKVEQVYRHMTQHFPRDLGFYMLWFHLACKQSQVNFPQQEAFPQFATGKLDTATIMGLNFILTDRLQGNCHVDAKILEKIFDSLIHNPHAHFYLSFLHHLYALFYAQEHRYTLALQQAEQSLALEEQPALRIQQIEWLITVHRLKEAQLYLDTARKKLNPLFHSLYDEQLNALEALINRTPPSKEE